MGKSGERKVLEELDIFRRTSVTSGLFVKMAKGKPVSAMNINLGKQSERSLSNSSSVCRSPRPEAFSCMLWETEHKCQLFEVAFQERDTGRIPGGLLLCCCRTC